MKARTVDADDEEEDNSSKCRVIKRLSRMLSLCWSEAFVNKIMSAEMFLYRYFCLFVNLSSGSYLASRDTKFLFGMV